jgi:FixJ family two-component response regulator/CRP-like cAMP-binding protein
MAANCGLSQTLRTALFFSLLGQENARPMSEVPAIVYVVDDSESVRESIDSLIRSAGLEVKVFGTAREYLEWQRPDTPSCLILDANLPGKSGLEVQRDLADLGIDIPIIFITGHGDISMSVRAMKAGAIDFFSKPFNNQHLLDAVQIGLERDRTRRFRNHIVLAREHRARRQPSSLFPDVRRDTFLQPAPGIGLQGVRTGSSSQTDGNLQNKLLLNLPDAELKLIFPRLVFLPLRTLDVLNEAGEAIEYGYFLNRGVASILNVMKDGKSVEIGLSGNEGFIGVPLLVGFESSPNRVTMQVEGNGFRIGGTELVLALRRCPTLQSRLHRYAQIVGLQSGQLAACNRLHLVEQRLARWLLMCQDRTSSALVPLTQELFAYLLGTNRSSITVAAGILQRAALISYISGRVTILNRVGLESAACECYGAMSQQAAKWDRESA